MKGTILDSNKYMNDKYYMDNPGQNPWTMVQK